MSIVDQIANDWAVRCFGVPHVIDKRARAMRLLEEAAELAQKCGVTGEEMGAIICMVDDRGGGKHPNSYGFQEIYQEVGQVMLTLSVLCDTLKINRQSAYEIEVRRVLGLTKESFAQRNAEKTLLIEKKIEEARASMDAGPERER